MGTFAGKLSVAAEVDKCFAGVNDLAREVDKIFVGDENGVAQLLWSGFTPMYFSSYNNILYKSEDLENWDVANTFSNYIRGMLFANGKYYLIDSSNVYTSDDGVSWTVLSKAPVSGFIQRFKYLNGKFIIIQQEHKIYYSDDAITWTSASLSTNYSGIDAGFLLLDILYGTVGGTTGYYLLVQRQNLSSSTYVCGIILARHDSFENMVGGKNPTLLFTITNSNYSIYARMTLVGGKIYIVHCSNSPSGGSGGDRTYVHVYGTSRTDAFSNTSYKTSIVWSNRKGIKWKLRASKVYTLLYGSTSSSSSSKSTSLKEWAFMIQGLCVDDRLVYIEGGNSGTYANSTISYSDDGGETFTTITLDKNIHWNQQTTDQIVTLYSNEYSGFYTE